MSFNKKEIKVDNAKAPKKPKDVIYDPMGQWKYPGQVTKIPSNHITMKGVNYPVLGIDDEGNEQIMLPGLDYVYPGDNVTEYPMMQYGGSKPISPDKALAFLQTGSIRGRALSDRQLEYFAEVAGVELDENGNIITQNDDDNENPEFKKGGWLDKYHSLPRRTTSKNIKTSINPLFTRNYTIYGPPGRRLYKPKLQDGGENYLEGDLISKVLVERNKDKDFIKRAMYPNRTIQYNPDMSISTHLMEWGEDESGQAFMYPSIFNPNNEVVKVPNQYADYISSKGYKKATGMNEYQQGGWLEEFQNGGNTASKMMKQYYESPQYYKSASGRVEETASPIDFIVMNPMGFGKSYIKAGNEFIKKITPKLDEPLDVMFETLAHSTLYGAPVISAGNHLVNLVQSEDNPYKGLKAVGGKSYDKWLEKYSK